MFLFVTILYSLGTLYHQGHCLLPAKLSPVVLDGAISSECPRDSINAEVNATKAEIQQAVTDIINPILDRRSTSPQSCANATGWTRVAFLNMSDPGDVCPSSLMLHTSPVRGCGRQLGEATSCDSVVFPLGGGRYSNVCGRVLAYQRGFPDAFRSYLTKGQTTIDSAYVDGVSLTYGGTGSRQHIWTFAAAIYEQDPDYNIIWNCPCTNVRYSWTYQLPPFIGNNYFCDTGNPGPIGSSTTYYSSDPLWDGEGCGPTNTCCQLNNPPWFQTTLPQSTSDNIELRLCHGEELVNEEIIINLIEIYVQ